MKHNTKKENSGESRQNDIYRAVTMRILDNMIKGQIPWRDILLPVKGGREPFYNPLSGTDYKFLNCMLLGEPGEYATMSQINEKGGHVLAGSKGRMIVKWGWYIPAKHKAEQEELEKEGKSIEHLKLWYLKKYTVFNLKDTEGLKLEKDADPVAAAEHESVDPTLMADTVIRDYRRDNTVTYQEDPAYSPAYMAASDRIEMPTRERFVYEEDYYASVFEQIVHSTAMDGRSERPGEWKALVEGTESVKEELIAEMASSMVLGACGLKRKETHQQLDAVCQKWIQAMNNDYRLIVNSAGPAERAAKYVLGQFAE